MMQTGADPTGRKYGVAWYMLGRLVGDCGWKAPEQKSFSASLPVALAQFIREWHQDEWLSMHTCLLLGVPNPFLTP